MKQAYTYDDITLIPRIASDIAHRADVDTSLKMGTATLKLPIIAAPMKDVCDEVMAQALVASGGMGIIHRFQSIDDQAQAFKNASGWFRMNRLQIDRSIPFNTVGAAIGVADDWKERYTRLFVSGCRVFCLDTANGVNKQTKEVLSFLGNLQGRKDIFIIAGNVASKETFALLRSWGADAIRVGIAGGSVCETRTETGVYSPMATAVMECASIADGKCLLIADGGIKTPADMCKALALGADAVMMGGVLAGTKEAPGEIIVVEGRKYKLLRGSASYSVQQTAGRDDPEYVEGSETLVPYKGEVEKILIRYRNGLRSSMSYMGAKNLQEFALNASFMVTR